RLVGDDAVPSIDQPLGDTARDRRAHGRETYVKLSRADIGAGRAHLGNTRALRGLALLDFLLADSLRSRERFRTRKFGPGIGEHRLRPGELGAGLRQSGFGRARVDGEERLPRP